MEIDRRAFIASLGGTAAVSLMDSITELMGYSLYFTQFSGRRHVPNGISHPTLSPYESFETADGRRWQADNSGSEPSRLA